MQFIFLTGQYDAKKSSLLSVTCANQVYFPRKFLKYV